MSTAPLVLDSATLCPPSTAPPSSASLTSTAAALLVPGLLCLAFNPSFTRLLPSLPLPLVLSGWIDSAAATTAPTATATAAASTAPHAASAMSTKTYSTPTITIPSVSVTVPTSTGNKGVGLTGGTVTRPVFIPPKYAKLGANGKDLFKKKYDYIHTLKTTHRSPRGVIFESGVQSVAAGAPVRGYVKATALSAYGYTVEGEANTDVAADTKATIKSSSLYPGLTVAATACSNKAGVNYTGEAEFIHDAFTVTSEVKSDLTKHAAKVSVSAGYDGIAIGGIVATDLTNGADVTDYNVGLEYIQPTYVASLYTEDRAETATVQYYQRVSQQHAVAAAVKVNIAGDKSAALTLGTDYVLDATTSVKAKVEVPSALVSVALEHRLKSPSLLLGLAASYNPLGFQKAVKAEQFGVTLSFGDY